MQAKVIQGDLQPIKNISGREANTKGAASSLRAATKPEGLRNDAAEGANTGGLENTKANAKRFEHIQNIDIHRAPLDFYAVH